MQKKKATTSINSRAGNSDELERLEELLETEKKNASDLQKEVEILRAKKDEIARELGECKISLAKAFEKIKATDQFLNKKVDDQGKSGDYLDIATEPMNGQLPPSTKIDGMIVPRKTDEYGFGYESLPAKRAAAVLTEFSGYKRHLLGPVDQITAQIPNGLYAKDIIIKRKKLVVQDGVARFVEVTVEESPIKTD